MTILPKKKSSQEKRGIESGENHSHHGGHSHGSHHLQHSSHHTHRPGTSNDSTRGGARPKSRNSPPRWVNLGSLEERLSVHDNRTTYDGSDRRETTHSGSKRARHRASPHCHEYDRSARPIPRKHHRDIPSGSGNVLDRRDRENLAESEEDDLNSGDEYDNIPESAETIQEREALFEKMLKEKKGFIIKKMEADGACMFRAVADQVYGDQEWHAIIRSHCMDYMQGLNKVSRHDCKLEVDPKGSPNLSKVTLITLLQASAVKNVDYFSQYVTEDFSTYIERKRMDSCHGNHVEMQALSEMYNRNIEVYVYSTEPINTFHTINQTDNEPLRLSYHGNIHYNSVVNPHKATIGVGLGMPSFVPGLADKMLIKDAVHHSENTAIETAMLEDKLRATDWEATSEAIEEQVARESYLQWLKDNEKRERKKARPPSAACSSAPPDNSPGRGTWEGSNKHPSDALPFRAQHSPRNRLGSNKSAQNSPDRPDGPRKGHHSPKSSENSSSSARTDGGFHPDWRSMKSKGSPGNVGDTRKTPSPPAGPSGLAASYITNPSASFMENFPPAEFGISEWETEEAILASVLAQSQQEYLDILKKTHKDNEDEET